MKMNVLPSEFWKLTLKEYNRICKAYQSKRKDEMDLFISMTWYNNALSRQKKLPKLSSILKNKPKMTEEQMFANMKNIFRK